MAKSVELWANFKTKQSQLHSPLTAIHFSSSEDKSPLHEGLDHILLVFVGFFVAITKEIVQDG